MHIPIMVVVGMATAALVGGGAGLVAIHNVPEPVFVSWYCDGPESQASNAADAALPVAVRHGRYSDDFNRYMARAPNDLCTMDNRAIFVNVTKDHQIMVDGSLRQIYRGEIMGDYERTFVAYTGDTPEKLPR